MSNVSSTKRVNFPWRATVTDAAGNFSQTVGSWLPTLQSYRDGSSDPKYKEKIAAGLNATGALTGQRDSIEDSTDGTFVLTERNVDGQITQRLTFDGMGSIPQFANPFGSFATADNLALKVALQRIGDRRTSF